LTPARNTINADQLANKRRLRRDGRLNTVGLAIEVQVECAHDDAGMIWARPVKAGEIPAIQRQHAPRIAAREIEHRLVSQGLAGLAKVAEG